MPRPRAFDSEQVESLFLSVFWEKGVSATTIDDLCRLSGLSKSSLYAAFGSKSKILETCLKRYVVERIGHIAEVFSHTASVREGIRTLGTEIIAEVENGPGRRGCFIGNCASEHSLLDASGAQLVRCGLETMEQIFAEAIRRDPAFGPRSGESEVGALAKLLVASFQGFRLLSKTNPGRAALESVIQMIERTVVLFQADLPVA